MGRSFSGRGEPRSRRDRDRRELALDAIPNSVLGGHAGQLARVRAHEQHRYPRRGMSEDALERRRAAVSLPWEGYRRSAASEHERRLDGKVAPCHRRRKDNPHARSRSGPRVHIAAYGYASSMAQPLASSNGSAVVVEGVSKSFRVPDEATHTLKERALHPFRRTRHDTLQALRTSPSTVREGEFFGIVGRNGSGKSTLLKCLAGIYGVDERPDLDATAACRPSSSWASASTRTWPPATTWCSTAIMLGLTPREARARYERVIEFAELEEFQDLKLKNYSSGMHVRLAFSVAIQVDADILLIDEVLAVGDAAFQQKCFDVFNRIATTAARSSS